MKAIFALTLSAVLALPILGCSSSEGNPELADTPIAFDQVSFEQGKAYRLVVTFTQLDDDFAPSGVEVALDVPFAPGQTTVDLSTLRAPAAHTLFCPRSTKQRRQPPGECDANAAYHVSFGAIAIVEDANRNGKVDFGLSGGDGVATLAEGDAYVASARGVVLHDPSSGSVMPTGSDGKSFLVDGPVPAGYSIYEAYRLEGATFDRLRRRVGPLQFTRTGANLT